MQTKSEILKLIKSIHSRGKKLDSDIQTAAIHAVFYSICYGDVTIGQKLSEAFSSGLRKAALVGFLEEYGQFEYKGKELVYRKNDQLSAMLEDEQSTEEYCDEIKVQWVSFKPETIKSKHDLMAETKAFIAKMEREIKAGNATNTDIYDVIAKAANTFFEQLEEESDEQEEEQSDDPVMTELSNHGFTMEDVKKVVNL